MKTKLLVGASAMLVVIICLDFAPAGGQPPSPGVIQFDQGRVAAVFARGGGVLLDTNNFKIQVGRRSGPGVVELHERDSDIFYILEGTATFVTGGAATEMQTTTPGEVRGKAITGGEEHHLAKGDIITIPSGVPHWFKETSTPFDYFIVKVTK